ncbi:MAG: thioesterase family protein [Flavobacteriales bacterium]|nr:thioesterase family protein [Flavobacteriales bacterium]
MEALSHPFRQRLHLRWADIDANYHLRHSAYYDLGAQQRMDGFAHFGLTQDGMREMAIGPVLFREECHFRSEIGIQDEVYLEMRITGLGMRHHKFRFEHLFRGPEGRDLARLEVEGAWIDIVARKVVSAPAEVMEAMDRLPRTTEFAWF